MRVLLFTYLLNILCIALVYDWFHIHQEYLVALIGLMEFYNKMMMTTYICEMTAFWGSKSISKRYSDLW
jgi:hypothetical protein